MVVHSGSVRGPGVRGPEIEPLLLKNRGHTVWTYFGCEGPPQDRDLDIQVKRKLGSKGCPFETGRPD